jgi:hypothetical protein
MFTFEKAPFLLSTLFAIFAWTTNQLSAELSKSPIIEYEQVSSLNNVNGVGYNIHNISAGTLFENLVFTLKTDKKICINDPILEFKAPADKHTDDHKPTCQNQQSAVFDVGQLHPNSKLTIFIPSDAEKVISSLYLSGDTPTKLIGSSIETFIIKNKVEILSWLFAFWTLGILLYLFFFRKMQGSN